MQSQKAIEHK